jgi:dTDP-4-dehydrorhamnose reductase
MRVLLTGAKGQLGRALQASCPPDCQFVARGHDTLDITDAAALAAMLDRDTFHAVINAAAYTNVEAAERASAEAFRINGVAAGMLAEACAGRGVHLVHVSTDFVFDGVKTTPYTVQDGPRPLNAYGASKLEGEQRVLDVLPGDSCVVRTSWLHGAHGANFVTKVLQRMKTGDTLRVVTDEVGSPTAVGSLAPALWQCAVQKINGIQHWSDAGAVTRYEFAIEIARQAHQRGLIEKLPSILPARVADFPSGVRRPAYSVLDSNATQQALRLEAPRWQDGLALTLQHLAQERHTS